MTPYLITYAVSLVSLIALDAIWLGGVMRRFYSSRFGELMKSPLDFRYALGFYFLYTIGLMILVVLPSVEQDSLHTALYLGGVLGATAYMTFDMTSASIIKRFPVSTIIPDIIWGAIVTALVSGVGFLTYTSLI